MTPSASANTPQILVPTDFDETVMRQSSDDVALIYWLSGGERTPEGRRGGSADEPNHSSAQASVLLDPGLLLGIVDQVQFAW